MKRFSFALALPLAISLLIAGCGTPGAPQPPSLRLPKPVEDLKAVRKGDKVYLTWTAPTETTDGQAIRSAGTVRICRSYRTDPNSNCKNAVIEVPLLPTTEPKLQTATDDLSGLLYSTLTQDFVTYNVEAANNRGRTAGPSNGVTVFLAPSLPPVTDLKVTLQPDAVSLNWTMPQAAPSPTLKTAYLYRVFRASPENEAKKSAERERVLAGLPLKPGEATYADKTFQWEKKYLYRVTGVTQVLTRDGQLLSEFEGGESAPIEIFAHDIFPPAAPRGVQAVFSGALEPTQNFVDITWSPNEEPDLAGYNVYRRENGASPTKLNNELLKSPSFRDNKVTAGKSYSYTITAVDVRGNESQPSSPATESIPQKNP